MLVVTRPRQLNEMTNAQSKPTEGRWMMFNGIEMPYDLTQEVIIDGELLFKMPKKVFDSLNNEIERIVKLLMKKYMADPTAPNNWNGDIETDNKLFHNMEYLDKVQEFIVAKTKNVMLEVNAYITLCAAGRRLRVAAYQTEKNNIRFNLDFPTKEEYKENYNKKLTMDCICGKKTKYTCSRCNFTKYCSKECQVASHPIHKKFCSAIVATKKN